MSIVPHKTCTRCGQTKPLDEFGIERKRPDGHAVYCKVCRRTMANDRYQRDPGVRQSAIKRSGERAKQLKNDPRYREQMRQGMRRYNQTEKGRRANRKRVKRLRQTNPTVRAYFDQYEKKRRETDPAFLERWRFYKRQKNHERRARVAANDEMYTRDEWNRLCAFYDHRCLCCGKRRPLTVDHIVPVTKGGSNTIQNLQPLCRSCNSRKSDRTIDYRSILPPWMGSDV